MRGCVSQRQKSLRFSMQIIGGRRGEKFGIALILVWCCCILVLLGALYQDVKGEIGKGGDDSKGRLQFL